MTETEFLTELKGAQLTGEEVNELGQVTGIIRLKPPPNSSLVECCPITYVASKLGKGNFGVDKTDDAAKCIEIDEFDALIIDAADHNFQKIRHEQMVNADSSNVVEYWIQIGDIRCKMLKALDVIEEPPSEFIERYKRYQGWA